MKPVESSQADARSPLAGCGILIAALLVMVFLVVFSIVTLFRQYNEIAKFTGEVSKPLEVTPLQGNEAMMNSLSERIEVFRQQLDDEKESRLELNVDEINLLIAVFDSFKDLRKTFRILELNDQGIRIQVSFPLNGKPRLARKDEGGLVASDNRYLNAVLTARPVLLKHELVLQLDRIDVTGAVVPHEFTEQMSPYRIAERYVTDPVLGPAMAKLTRVEVAGGKLILSRVPGEVLADEITDAQVDHASKRFLTILGLAACGFLVFAGIVIYVGMRKKAQES